MNGSGAPTSSRLGFPGAVVLVVATAVVLVLVLVVVVGPTVVVVVGAVVVGAGAVVTKPVKPGALIQPSGVIKAKQSTAKSRWVRIDVVVKNQHGEKVATGEAMVEFPMDLFCQ